MTKPFLAPLAYHDGFIVARQSGDFRWVKLPNSPIFRTKHDADLFITGYHCGLGLRGRPL